MRTDVFLEAEAFLAGGIGVNTGVRNKIVTGAT